MAALANSYVGNWAFGYSPDHGEHGIHTTFYMGQKAAKLGLAEAYLMQNRNIDDLRFAATLIENQRILDRNMANFHRQLGQHADADFIADDNKQVEILQVPSIVLRKFTKCKAPMMLTAMKSLRGTWLKKYWTMWG